MHLFFYSRADIEVDWGFLTGQWRYHTGTGELNVFPIQLAIAIAGIPGKTSSLITATQQNPCTFKTIGNKHMNGAMKEGSFFEFRHLKRQCSISHSFKKLHYLHVNEVVFMKR